MKIIAEFNSNEELSSFISTFSTTTMHAGAFESTLDVVKVDGFKIVDKPKEEATKDDIKEIVSKEADIEKPKIEITKEMVRGLFTKIIKAGKQKEAKELTDKYGATRLPDIKIEDYSAIYKEAEELI
jgi:hypothetical protein